MTALERLKERAAEERGCNLKPEEAQEVVACYQAVSVLAQTLADSMETVKTKRRVDSDARIRRMDLRVSETPDCLRPMSPAFGEMANAASPFELDDAAAAAIAKSLIPTAH